MQGRWTKELKLMAAASLYILKGGVFWGAITFLVTTVGAAVVLNHAPPETQTIWFCYMAAGLAFIFGSLVYAKEVLDITNPARIACGLHTRPRVWVWPFLAFAWMAILLEHPAYLALGAVVEGFLVSQSYSRDDSSG